MKKKKKVIAVVGTRPDAIKMCPLIIELRSREDIEVKVCATGQHRELLSSALDAFGVTPDVELRIMSEGQSLFDITDRLLLTLGELCDSLFNFRRSLLEQGIKILNGQGVLVILGQPQIANDPFEFFIEHKPVILEILLVCTLSISQFTQFHFLVCAELAPDKLLSGTRALVNKPTVETAADNDNLIRVDFLCHNGCGFFFNNDICLGSSRATSSSLGSFV